MYLKIKCFAEKSGDTWTYMFASLKYTLSKRMKCHLSSPEPYTHRLRKLLLTWALPLPKPSADGETELPVCRFVESTRSANSLSAEKPPWAPFTATPWLTMGVLYAVFRANIWVLTEFIKIDQIVANLFCF